MVPAIKLFMFCTRITNAKIITDWSCVKKTNKQTNKEKKREEEKLMKILKVTKNFKAEEEKEIYLQEKLANWDEIRCLLE